MSSSQFCPARPKARQRLLSCAALVGLAALGGCSLFRPAVQPAPATTAVTAPADDSDIFALTPQTTTDAADEDSADAGTTTVMSTVSTSLKPTAPKNYVVRRGDTLWGIANMFLRNPWEWPEIWYVNPEIHNPHRIYPGDTVRLALAGDGRTVLQVVRGPGALNATRLEPLLRSAPLDTPIDSIPYTVISAFISRPGILTREQIDAAPYVVALAQNHDVAGTGHEIYVKKTAADAGANYSVMHVDEPLTDPDSGQRLGYVAIYTGTAQITQAGPVAKAVLTSSARETLQGDLLIAEEHTPTTDLVPHTPEKPVAGRVIDVINNVQLAGQYDVVVLNRGSNDGLERGSVLTVDQRAVTVEDPCANIGNVSTCLLHSTVTLPTDVAGTVLVFRTYPRMSYALIMQDTVPVQVGDRVRSP